MNLGRLFPLVASLTGIAYARPIRLLGPMLPTEQTAPELRKEGHTGLPNVHQAFTPKQPSRKRFLKCPILYQGRKRIFQLPKEDSILPMLP